MLGFGNLFGNHNIGTVQDLEPEAGEGSHVCARHGLQLHADGGARLCAPVSLLCSSCKEGGGPGTPATGFSPSAR